MNIYKSFASLKNKLKIMFRLSETIKETTNIAYLDKFLCDLKISQPNSLLHYGFSVYSQNDEDGIIQAIFNKIGIQKVTFMEFGVEPCENNTNFLILKDGRGVWIDKSLTEFKDKIGPKSKLLILDEFVNKDNVVDQVKKGLDFLKIDKKGLDFLSMDLDGNDYYYLKEMLSFGLTPSLICLEYNAKFPLPFEISIEYNENHCWKGDDYFSASLQSYINLLQDSYSLLCCNSNGINAFFIRTDLAKYFDVLDPEEIYMRPQYFLSSYYKGHPSSTRFIEDILK